MTQSTNTNPDSTHEKPPPRWLVIAAFAAIYILWGSTYFGIRIAIQTMPPFLMAGSRYFLAGVVLYGILWWKGEPAPRLAHWRDATIVGALLLLLQNAVLTWVELRTPSALAALIVAATPFWMILLNRLFFGVRLTIPLIAGLFMGFAGVGVIVASKDHEGKSVVDMVSLGLLIAGSIFWASGTIYSRHARTPRNPLQATAMQMAAGGFLILIVSFVRGEPATFHISNVSRESWYAYAFLAIFGSLVGYTAYVWLLKVSTIARVSTSAFVNPLVAVILGATLGHEVISPGIILAAVLIIGAVMLINWKRSVAPALRK